NVLVYLVTVYQGAGLNAPGGKVFEDGALIGAAIDLNGEWYRLVTAMFLHAGILHIAFNMLALYWLGTVVEQALGTWRFLLVYFVSGLAGSAGALLLTGPFAVTVGASGAIFGIMGSLLILEYVATGTFAGQAMALIVLNLALTLTIPNISVGGHLGGLVVGIAVVSLLVASVRVENYDYGGQAAPGSTDLRGAVRPSGLARTLPVRATARLASAR